MLRLLTVIALILPVSCQVKKNYSNHPDPINYHHPIEPSDHYYKDSSEEGPVSLQERFVSRDFYQALSEGRAVLGHVVTNRLLWQYNRVPPYVTGDGLKVTGEGRDFVLHLEGNDQDGDWKLDYTINVFSQQEWTNSKTMHVLVVCNAANVCFLSLDFLAEDYESFTASIQQQIIGFQRDSDLWPLQG